MRPSTNEPGRSVNESNNTDIDSSVSRDSLFEGELICFQHAKGYRFSIDAVLVAHFMDVRKNDRILDLGTGCGIICLILLYRYYSKVREICGIDIQSSLAKLARKNLLANDLSERGRIIEGDIKEIQNLIQPESYDKIVCNPPFYTPGSGRTSTVEEANLARHQILATLQDFLQAAAIVVKNRGSVYFIYPAEKVCEFVLCAQMYKLEVKRIQFVYSYPHETHSARLVLIHCLKNGGAGTEIMVPFYVYCEKNGPFSPEMQACYTKNINLSSTSNG